jgi:hypothetical protein
MESLLSLMLAAALLTVISFHGLWGTVVGFICSALLVVSVTLPQAKAVVQHGGVTPKTFRGMSIYLRTLVCGVC